MPWHRVFVPCSVRLVIHSRAESADVCQRSSTKRGRMIRSRRHSSFTLCPDVAATTLLHEILLGPGLRKAVLVFFFFFAIRAYLLRSRDYSFKHFLVCEAPMQSSCIKQKRETETVYSKTSVKTLVILWTGIYMFSFLLLTPNIL